MKKNNRIEEAKEAVRTNDVRKATAILQSALLNYWASRLKEVKK